MSTQPFLLRQSDAMANHPDTTPAIPALGTVAVADDPARVELRSAVGRRTVDLQPDFQMATAWSRALKRIHHVEIRETSGDNGWRAWIHGTGHRTPTRCRISVPTAVALGLSRVPLVLALDDAVAREDS